jgi:hypothetical protein
MWSGVFAGVPNDGEYGSITCAVSVRSALGTKTYVMSCQHVFSPDRDGNDTRIQSGSRVAPVVSRKDPQPELRNVATTAPYGGRLRVDGLPSFDVQLAEVSDTAWLGKALEDLPLSGSTPYVSSRSALDEVRGRNFEILVPANHRCFIGRPRFSISAQFSAIVDESVDLDYDFYHPPRHADVHHLRLIQLTVLDPESTIRGDSGSPVIVRNVGGSYTLVGMHIAGTPGTKLTYAIPAWQLFDPAQYWNLPAGATLRPVNP